MGITLESLLKTQNCLHIFGYGSLTWKPDFEYDQFYLGYIKGYERRFWQGSEHHRGTPEKPGRVLTLTKVPEGKCWGKVFEVSGTVKIRSVLDYLQLREQSLGHYEISVVPVHTKDKTYYSIVYYATPKNSLFLGEDPLEKIADDIATCSGKAGHNTEYLFRLADFMREHLPNEPDKNLYELEKLVRKKLGLCSKHILSWKQLLECPNFRKFILQTDNVVETTDRTESRTSLIAYV